MAAGDEAMCVSCRQLGLLPLLVNQLHLDIHSLDEPPLPPGAANILTLSSLPGTPKSPHKAAGGHGGGPGAAPASPLWRSGSSSGGSGGSSPRAPPQAGPCNRGAAPELHPRNPDNQYAVALHAVRAR